MNRTNYKATLTACYFGYITQAIVNNLAPLLFLIFRDRLGIPLSQITLITSLNFIVQLLVDLLSVRFVDRIGYRKCIVAAHFFSAAGLIGMSVLPFIMKPFAGLLIALFFYAVGGGLIEVLISPIAQACPTSDKSSQMSLLHSFYCWGTVAVVLFSTLFLFFAGKENWPLLPILWSVLPLLNGFTFMKVPIRSLIEDNAGMSVKELFSSGLFLICILLMFAAGSSEQAMSQWASAFAENGLGVNKAVGDVFGPCLFSVLMGSSRVIFAKVGEKADILKFIMFSGVLCAASYLIASLIRVPVLAFVGCALCGFSVGVLWPGVFSLASSSLPSGGTAMFALLALAGDLGCSAGPGFVGIISSMNGDNIKKGLLAAVLFPVLLLICTFIFKKFTKKDRILQ